MNCMYKILDKHCTFYHEFYLYCYIPILQMRKRNLITKYSGSCRQQVIKLEPEPKH